VRTPTTPVAEGAEAGVLCGEAQCQPEFAENPGSWPGELSGQPGEGGGGKECAERARHGGDL